MFHVSHFTHSEWIPKSRAVEHLPGRRNRNPDETEESKDDGDDDKLNVLRPLVFRVALYARQRAFFRGRNARANDAR